MSRKAKEDAMERTVLLVDDVQLFLEIQKEFLKDSSLEVLTARNGAEALRVVQNRRPDLVFMDFEMPEMNGADCCRAIKSDPSCASIPVVMITAKGDQESEARCRLAGCNEYLTKPLNRSVFLETAGKFIRDLERREVRQRVNLPGALHSRGTTHPCTIMDLSSGGAFLMGDLPAEPGRIVQITFRLPDGTPVECRGKIVWSRGPGSAGYPGVGVGFILPPEAMKGALEKFLTAPQRPARTKSGA